MKINRTDGGSYRLFEKFIKNSPVSHALIRGLESQIFEKLKIKSPSLDLGCGDGSFALLTFGRGKIDVGLDKNEEEIEKVGEKGIYKKTVVADAQKLPFVDKKFKTIISNSVLEHVKNPDKVLGECFRVLVPGGKLIFTIPGKRDRKYWFWAKIFNGLYTYFKDRLMGHSEFYDKDVWIEKLKKAGFREIEVFSYVPKKTVILLDFLVPFGFFYYLTKRIFGPRRFLAKIFLPFFYVDKKNGLGYCFITKKR